MNDFAHSEAHCFFIEREIKISMTRITFSATFLMHIHFYILDCVALSIARVMLRVETFSSIQSFEYYTIRYGGSVFVQVIKFLLQVF